MEGTFIILTNPIDFRKLKLKFDEQLIFGSKGQHCGCKSPILKRQNSLKQYPSVNDRAGRD